MSTVTHKLGVASVSCAATCLLATAAPAAVTTVAEYHLGEAGSLGTNKRPIDTALSGTPSGAQNYGTDVGGSSAATATAAVFAPGSTAYLDTSNAANEGFYGNSFASLQTDNFALGVYVRAAANTAANQGDVFTVGGSTGSAKLSLASNGWAASLNGVSWIGTANGTVGSFAADAWVHLAMIRSGGTMRFYINGVDQGGTTSTSVPVNADSHLSVSPGGATYFDGHLDEARVVTFASGDSTAAILSALQVPEPTSLAAVGTAALGLLSRRRRR